MKENMNIKGMFLYWINNTKVSFIAILIFVTYAAFAIEICNNGIDDDGDGLIDCYDNECGDSAACDGFYIRKIDTTSSACTSVPSPNIDMDILWKQQGAYTFAALSYFVAGDIDADGIVEVLMISGGGKILVVNGQTGQTKYEIDYPTAAGLGSFMNNDMAIADVDYDGFAEIFLFHSDGAPGFDAKVMCLEHDGTFKWLSSEKASAFGKPGLADFNHDDTVECYVGDHIFNALTGVLLSRIPPPPSGPFALDTTYPRGQSLPIAADVLPDAFCPDCAGLEYIAGPAVYAVNLDKDSLILITTTQYKLNGGASIIADFNKDGRLDILTKYAAFPQAHLYVWDPQTGNLISNKIVINDSASFGRPNIGNFDTDTFPEIGLSGRRSYFALDYDGINDSLSVKWIHPIQDVSSGGTGSTLFDLNCDGRMEIIYRDEVFLYIMDSETGTVHDSIVCSSGTTYEFPIIIDLNNNGSAEILCGCGQQPQASSNQVNGHLEAYTSAGSSWAYTRKVFNQYNYFGVNINDDLSVPKVQQNQALIPVLNSFMNQPSLLDENGLPDCRVLVNDLTIFIDTFELDTPDCDNITFSVTVCALNDLIGIGPGITLAIYGQDQNNNLTLIDTVMINQYFDTIECFSFQIALPLTNISQTTQILCYVNDLGRDSLPPLNVFNECTLSNNYDSVIFYKTLGGIIFPNDTAVCSNTTIQLTASGAQSYNWSPSTGINNTTIPNPEIAISYNSVQYILITRDSSGCTFTDTVNIGVHQLDLGVISDTCIEKGTCITLSTSEINVGTIYEWISEDIIVSNDLKETFCLEDSTLFVLNATDSNLCHYSDSVFICILIDQAPIFPKIFSPNGDGNNDQFLPSQELIGELVTFRIYNRWGNLLFESNIENEGWDGSYLENTQPIGVYLYEIIYLNLEKEEIRDSDYFVLTH